MKTVTEKAYAKINLYLDVLDKREDGYHNILSVMHDAPLYDTLTVSVAEDVFMTCTDKSLSCGEDNLCIKAARAFFSNFKGNGGCFIELEKNIPMKAGLGGGSSDCAAVLRALNYLYGSPFTVDELCAIGAGLGADVPFCVRGGSCKCEGIGEILSPFPHLPECFIVISGGIGEVSTPVAYRMIDSTPPSKSGDIKALCSALRSKDLEKIGKALYNRFEDACSECESVKRIMLESGALGALMSGSGPSVFGLFADKESAEKAKKALEDQGLSAFR